MIRPIFTLSFGIEMITTVPFIISIFHRPARNWWVPVFLNIWMANQALSNIIVSTFSIVTIVNSNYFKTFSKIF